MLKLNARSLLKPEKGHNWEVTHFLWKLRINAEARAKQKANIMCT